MALEASDLNDGTILQQTRQITDERGNIQFAIKLPSGRDLKSEFMRKEDARQGIKKWLEVVKEQAVADADAERLERAAKSRRGNLDLERRPGDDKPLFRAGGARVDDKKPDDAGPTYEDYRRVAEAPLPAKVPTGTTQHVISVPPGKADKDKDGLPLGYGDGPHPDSVVDPLEYAKAQRDIYAKQVEGLLAAQKKLRQWTIIVENLEEFE